MNLVNKIFRMTPKAPKGMHEWVGTSENCANDFRIVTHTHKTNKKKTSNMLFACVRIEFLRDPKFE